MADTVVNTLYPPLIETFQPAFLYNTNALITFSLSPFNSINEITNIHVTVVDQRNNSNVLKTVLNYTQQEQVGTEDKIDSYVGITNGVLIAEIPKFDKESLYKQKKGIFQYDPVHDLYAINILPKWLSDNNYWNNNQYYQVQIRFDKNTSNWHSDNATFATYMLDNREYFSEWSSVTLIKPILNPVLSIAQLSSSQTKYTYPGSFHISGSIIFEKPSSSQNGLTYPETEHLQSYRITVIQNDITIIDSDWIYSRQNISNENTSTIDYLLDLTNSHEGDNLIITITCKTNNGYVFKQDYSLVLQSYNEILNKITWNNIGLNDNNIDVNQEDGIAKIRFSASKKDNSWLKAVIYFRRACSKDNFKKWDLIYQCNYINTSDNIEVFFDDYTIGSLYEYQYSAQICITDSQEIWSPIYQSAKIYPKFYEMLLMRQNKQIAIRYNGQVSSWKPTVNRQKIDTLGGRYPKFVENAAMNYKTYQISGLISAEGDFNRKFLNETDDSDNVQRYDREFGEQYLIRNDTAADGEIEYDDSRNPQIRKNQKVGKELYAKNNFSGELNNQHDTYPHNHWYWEREFREALVNWLNDGEPKLYRSMPEGNIAVMLTDINLTPDSQLSRMLYNFSATMYEVGNGYSLEELDNLGIINIPSLNNIFLSSTDTEEDDSEEAIGTLYIKTKQLTLSSDTNIKNWISGTTDYHNTNDIWTDMSLLEQLNEYYTSQNNKVNSSSIKLNNINIEFTTPPHYYTYDNKSKKFQLSWDDTTQQEVETEWLGYVVQISNEDDNSNMQQIFINEKGFYHIPSESNIKNIQILDGKANIVTECQYRVVPDTSNKTLSSPIPQKVIIGQYTADSLPLNTDIIPLILQNYEHIEYKNNLLFSKTYLHHCKGFLLDVTPYTCIRYIEKDDNEVLTLVVGQTGLFNAFEDWPLDSLIILGKRMVALKKYPYDIRDWEYFIDTEGDINNPKINGVYNKDGQDQIYYIDGSWYPINTITGIAEVPIYGMINYHGDLVKESL